MRIHDPGSVGLRRGLRAAVALPVGLAFTLYVLDDSTGAIFTVFGTVGLLINADFAGNARDRLASYLLTGVVGSLTLAIGFVASFNTPVAMATTFVMAFALSFANLLRGRVAVATPALLLLFVVAVSLESSTAALPHYLIGWWVAVVVSTITAIAILPRSRLSAERDALARVFTAAARGTRSMWLPPRTATADTAFADFDVAVQQLDDEFGGQPFRTSGITRRDQSLTLLVAMVNSIRLLLRHPGDEPLDIDPAPSPGRDTLAGAVADALDDMATAMGDPTHLPSAESVDRARVELTGSLQTRVVYEAEQGTAPAEISARVGADHVLRMVALIVEQLVEVVRIANRGAVEDLERRPPIPDISAGTILRAQLSLHSPWLRNALRSAFGLSIAILVVNITGVSHGFWVLLGVISILRFDAIGTRRFALQAVIGTVMGVIAAMLVLAAAHDVLAAMWMLLPVAVFLAAWSAVAVNYVVGQAAFSGLIIIGFGILSYPPRTVTGIIRVEDIVLGAAVALVVGLLMWPRGAVGYLRQELATALRASAAYLAAAIGSFESGAHSQDLGRARAQAIEAAQRAADTYDISLMQRGPTEDMRPWTAATVSSYLVISTARVIRQLVSTTPAIAAHPVLVDALHSAETDARAHWEQVATTVGAGNPAISGEPVATPYPVLAPIESDQDARALVVTVWIVDWVRHLDRMSTASTT